MKFCKVRRRGQCRRFAERGPYAWDISALITSDRVILALLHLAHIASSGSKESCPLIAIQRGLILQPLELGASTVSSTAR